MTGLKSLLFFILVLVLAGQSLCTGSRKSEQTPIRATPNIEPVSLEKSPGKPVQWSLRGPSHYDRILKRTNEKSKNQNELPGRAGKQPASESSSSPMNPWEWFLKNQADKDSKESRAHALKVAEQAFREAKKRYDEVATPPTSSARAPRLSLTSDQLAEWQRQGFPPFTKEQQDQIAQAQREQAAEMTRVVAAKNQQARMAEAQRERAAELARFAATKNQQVRMAEAQRERAAELARFAATKNQQVRMAEAQRERDADLARYAASQHGEFERWKAMHATSRQTSLQNLFGTVRDPQPSLPSSGDQVRTKAGQQTLQDFNSLPLRIAHLEQLSSTQIPIHHPATQTNFPPQLQTQGQHLLPHGSGPSSSGGVRWVTAYIPVPHDDPSLPIQNSPFASQGHSAEQAGEAREESPKTHRAISEEKVVAEKGKSIAPSSPRSSRSERTPSVAEESHKPLRDKGKRKAASPVVVSDSEGDSDETETNLSPLRTLADRRPELGISDLTREANVREKRARQLLEEEAQHAIEEIVQEYQEKTRRAGKDSEQVSKLRHELTNRLRAIDRHFDKKRLKLSEKFDGETMEIDPLLLRTSRYLQMEVERRRHAAKVRRYKYYRHCHNKGKTCSPALLAEFEFGFPGELTHNQIRYQLPLQKHDYENLTRMNKAKRKRKPKKLTRADSSSQARAAVKTKAISELIEKSPGEESREEGEISPSDTHSRPMPPPPAPNSESLG